MLIPKMELLIKKNVYLFPFSRYQAKCVIKFLFRQMTS